MQLEKNELQRVFSGVTVSEGVENQGLECKNLKSLRGLWLEEILLKVLAWDTITIWILVAGE